jgi:hypothetical protein
MRFAPSHLGNPPKMIRYGSAHVWRQIPRENLEIFRMGRW